MSGLVIVGVVATLLGVFFFSKIDSSQASDPLIGQDSVLADLEDDGDSNTVEVEIEGEVNHPGIYSMDPADTLGDLIAKAGGKTADADTDAYVSSYVIGTKDYFYIPSKEGEVCTPIESAKININDTSITAEELKASLGVTITQAEAIIEYREENGPYKSIEELLDVKGIGEKTYEKIRDLVTLK